MIPALFAAAKAATWAQRGIVAGVVVGTLAAVFGWGYLKGYSSSQKNCQANILAQVEESTKSAVLAHQAGAAVVRETQREERIVTDKMADVKKKVVSHAKKNPIPLTTATVAIYDRLISVPNETAMSVPDANPGTGSTEIPRGRVATETIAVLLDEEGNDIGLTTDELAQAAADFAEKYALIKNAYRGLSLWNDEREKIELERLP